MTIPVSNIRVFIVGDDETPDNQPIICDSLAQIEDFYGQNSLETSLGTIYFSGANVDNAKAVFIRYGAGQRSHLTGANIVNNLSEGISGSVSLTFDGFPYTANVDIPSGSNITTAAQLLQQGLNAKLAIAATTSDDTITPVTIKFIANVTTHDIEWISGDTPVIGGFISGDHLEDSGRGCNNEIIADRKGEYYTFSYTGVSDGPEKITETYGELHIGDRKSGQIKAGLGVSGVDTNTAIISYQGGGNWVVNRAQTASGNFNITAPSLQVSDYSLVGGEGQSVQRLEVSPFGDYDFDQISNTMSFASGSALLGLSQASGAIDSSPGGQHPTTDQYLNSVYSDMGGNFGSIQTTELRLTPATENWANAHSITFLPDYHTTTPAGTT